MTIDCPRCGLPLREESYEDVPVDACPECWGYWLDKGEFGLIADSTKFHFSDAERRSLLAWADVQWAKDPKKRLRDDPLIPCPHCKKLMEKVPMNVAVPITLDRCREHGIWFDARELKLAQILAEKAHWIRDFLFAKFKE
jgi:Zn-finger nucleic acid-binding protein